VDLEIFSLITLSNGSAVRLCGCRYVYSLRIRYGGTAANQLPILFLPPADIASRRVCRHQLSFLFIQKVVTAGAVDRLTDVTKFTGSHKERFSEDGKGKGIAGRRDVVDKSGYVTGFKTSSAAGGGGGGGTSKSPASPAPKPSTDD